MTLLEKLLVLHEGLVLKKYRCPAGKLTIGVGHNLDARPISGLPDEISKEKALEILADDIADTVADLDKRFPWWDSHNGVRQAAMIDLCFNMGLAGLCAFGNTLKAWQERRYDDAAAHLGKSKWATQVGTRAPRIQQMVRTGEWPEELARVAD